MRRGRSARTVRASAYPYLPVAGILAVVLLLGAVRGAGNLVLAEDFYADVLRLENPGIFTTAVAEEEPLSAGSADNEQIITLSELKPQSTPAETTATTTKPVGEMTVRPVSGTSYTSASGIFLKNTIGANIDIKTLLNSTLAWSIKGSGPHVLIIHTHGSEAYTPDKNNTYKQTDTDRTTDKNYNIVRVGDEIEKELTARGIKVVHDRNLYDSPQYNGAYTRALSAISAQMKKTPSIKVVIDVHRDAIVDDKGVKYKVAADIAGRKASQIMLVMGTGLGGLPHPDWKENLKLALRLQKSMNDQYPDLARPIHMTKNRYNQHVTKGSMIVEIGTSGNTLDESVYSGRLFADCLADVLSAVKK